MKNVIGVLLCLNLVFISCDRPQCITDNSVFKGADITSKEYVLELANQLQKVDNNQLTFWIKGYEKVGGFEYLNIYLQGDGLCAQTRLLVEDWSTLEYIRKGRGEGYSGAQIENLVMELKGSAITLMFTYVEHSAIVD
jgi:hypothetical protein